MLQKLSEQVLRRAVAKQYAWMPRVGSIGLAIAVAITYFFTARLSLALLTEPDGVVVFWPAAGISSGILIAFGRAARLPVAAGVMTATIAANLLGDRNIADAIIFALCNAGEAMLIAWLIEYHFGPGFSLDSSRRVLGLILATAVGTAISGVGGVAGFVLFHGSDAPILTTWLNWFVSDAIGVVSVAPLLVGLARAWHDLPQRSELVEGTLALVALAIVSAIGLGSPTDYWFTILPLALLFPLLLWPAVHCRPVFAAAAAFIIALAIVWTITFGIGRLGDPNIHLADRVHAAEAALLAISVCALVLAALFAERRRNEDHKGRLVAELDHRVKNMLTTVSVVASQTRDTSRSMEDFVTGLNGRIRSMASAHELLSIRRWQGIPLAELLQRELAPYTTSNNTEIDGPEVMLSADVGPAMAMVVHELVTNAAKYGALSTQCGRVSVRWVHMLNGSAGQRFVLEWQETGGPRVEAPKESGYGMSTIRELIPYEFGGTVDFSLPPDGVRCRFEIPAVRLGGGNHQSDRLSGFSSMQPSTP
jgi:two-component sensor histidine kinase/integral membrane sensor domain MASE1